MFIVANKRQQEERDNIRGNVAPYCSLNIDFAVVFFLVAIIAQEERSNVKSSPRLASFTSILLAFDSFHRLFRSGYIHFALTHRIIRQREGKEKKMFGVYIV